MSAIGRLQRAESSRSNKSNGPRRLSRSLAMFRRRSSSSRGKAAQPPALKARPVPLGRVGLSLVPPGELLFPVSENLSGLCLENYSPTVAALPTSSLLSSDLGTALSSAPPAVGLLIQIASWWASRGISTELFSPQWLSLSPAFLATAFKAQTTGNTRLVKAVRPVTPSSKGAPRSPSGGSATLSMSPAVAASLRAASRLPSPATPIAAPSGLDGGVWSLSVLLPGDSEHTSLTLAFADWSSLGSSDLSAIGIVNGPIARGYHAPLVAIVKALTPAPPKDTATAAALAPRSGYLYIRDASSGAVLMAGVMSAAVEASAGTAQGTWAFHADNPNEDPTLDSHSSAGANSAPISLKHLHAPGTVAPVALTAGLAAIFLITASSKAIPAAPSFRHNDEPVYTEVATRLAPHAQAWYACQDAMPLAIQTTLKPLTRELTIFIANFFHMGYLDREKCKSWIKRAFVAWDDTDPSPSELIGLKVLDARYQNFEHAKTLTLEAETAPVLEIVDRTFGAKSLHHDVVVAQYGIHAAAAVTNTDIPTADKEYLVPHFDRWVDASIDHVKKVKAGAFKLDSAAKGEFIASKIAEAAGPPENSRPVIAVCQVKDGVIGSESLLLNTIGFGLVITDGAPADGDWKASRLGGYVGDASSHATILTVFVGGRRVGVFRAEDPPGLRLALAGIRMRWGLGRADAAAWFHTLASKWQARVPAISPISAKCSELSSLLHGSASIQYANSLYAEAICLPDTSNPATELALFEKALSVADLAKITPTTDAHYAWLLVKTAQAMRDANAGDLGTRRISQAVAILSRIGSAGKLATARKIELSISERTK